MAAHATQHHLDDDRTQLGDGARSLTRAAWVVAVIGLVASVGLGFVADDDHSFKRFLHAYLAAYGFFLSVVIGALFFVIVQHLTRAGWSASVRRVAEAMAKTMPLLVVLSAPLLISVALNNGVLYPWARPLNVGEHEAKPAAAVEHAEAKPAADHVPAAEAAPAHEGAAASEQAGQAEGEHHNIDEEIAVKRAYLNTPFFFIRMAIYFAIWCTVGVWYWRQSVAQDSDGNASRTDRMQAFAPLAAILTMLALTFGSVDLFMSLDPLWYSTIFGVYYFAGCAIAIFAAMSLTLHALQTVGYLKRSVTVDHYQDLGKFLFGFVFFWGYIAFSQFMLQWYANLPEETGWWKIRGGSTVPADFTPWSYVLIALLFGKLLLPFGGLLSRHVKRNKAGLIFWSTWLLIFQALDIFWIVMPQLTESFTTLTLVTYLACFAGIGGAVFALFVKNLSSASLRPLRDPRLDEALAYTN